MNSRAGFESEYPFASNYLDLDGARYHYLDEGAGETLLFVHGNPTWSFAWRNLIKDLSADYRCVAVDHIGCGFSDKPQDYPYTLDQHVTNLTRLINTLELNNTTLIAHDWGGAIGMGAATRLPERFSRFVLMNTAAFRSTSIPLRIAVCRIPVFGTLAIRGMNAFARAAISMAVEKHERMTRAVRTGYLAPYGNWADRIATLRFVEDIPLKKQHPSYGTLQQIEEGLQQFREYPVLFPWGEQDWCFTPDFLEEFLNFFPGAETLRIPEAGHYVFEDAHEKLIPRIREFLALHPLNVGSV
ncbi:Haloalkane dehalogenase [Symmachiella dynata]|uniref:alpha/beta fold hydrolase n=1 Tax=Symmachiella dynata TaxID=2527995 RepID=UPI00118B8B46|nr:alpha/beta fold hydrolase [Symmachiella dynata]QDT50941.1 Haloalkane dehalogenase [Symmachiella dynata]